MASNRNQFKFKQKNKILKGIQYLKGLLEGGGRQLESESQKWTAPKGEEVSSALPLSSPTRVLSF